MDAVSWLGDLMMRRVAPAVALASVAVLASGGTVAWSYFTSPGSGAGTAATATTVAVTLSPATPTAALYPGGTASVKLTVSNPNASPVVVESLVLDTTQGSGGYAVDAGHSGCTLTSLTYTTQSNGGSGWTVPARIGGVNGTLAITANSSLAMATSAPNACQGATFTVYLTAGS